MDITKLKDRMNNKLQAQQQEPEKERTITMNNTTNMTNMGNMTNITNTAVAPINNNSNYLALTNNALEIIRANLKNQPLSFQLFDIIKSPSGGTTAFTVPTMAGDEVKKDITGIILDYDTPRAYWDTPDPVEGTPPVCYSRDSLSSFEGKTCSRCVYNDFGSKNGGDTQAKACKESVAIYLLRPDNIMPIIVRVPVSSKLIFQKYMTRLIGNMIPACGVVTRITLEKATNKTGQPYALYNFEAVSTLSPEETASARAFGQKFMEILNAADVPVMEEAV